ncbi:NAD(P)-binding protein [Lindgomyces ingoldianus]|uniref:NAD(P)-binding protein n=1 Tax=Lindgomyces ingoldianus TaxID=673940 RepID=A0ACB6QF38_9PLEO|nr:NAD(P)-binding protein [Lindgomyces ingoldianus]KAF2465598.1 NAD(P)-binding protein [Lindgomyces ingoldianus]
MIRSLGFVAALILLNSAWAFPGPNFLPLSEDQHELLVTILNWLLALCLVCEVNTELSRWAEDKWIWKDDKSVWNWGNEVAVITGGSKGIGAMVVKTLVSYGIRVAVLDVEPLSDVFLSEESNSINFYKCDITSRVQVHEAGEAIRSDFGSPSILVNNAGIGNANTILESSPEGLRTIFEVNLLSHWNTVQEFLPDMIAKKKGHIMSVASLAAFFGLAGMTDYSCTKAGLIAFHEGLTQELKHRYSCPQIKTTIVYPNWTRTRLIRAIEKGIRGPVMDPKDVAEAMAKQIISAKGGQVILGPNIAASIRALPTWLQEFIRDRMAHIVTVKATTAVA